MTTDLVERAKDLAYRSHVGQVDKAGRPYIEHVARVAAAVRSDCLCKNAWCVYGEVIDWSSVGSADPLSCLPAVYPCRECDEAEAVAWLHDVMEDCSVEYRNALLTDVPVEVFRAVGDLTRDKFSERTYYDRIRRNPIALRVKLADIADNSDEDRLAMLDKATADRLRRKYAKARKALGAPEGPQNAK